MCPSEGPLSPLSGLLQTTIPSDFELGGNLVTLSFDDVVDRSQHPPVEEPGDLGDRWFISTHRRARVAGLNTTVVRGSGELVVFSDPDAGQQLARTATGHVDSLIRTDNGMLYRSQGEQTLETFDSAGRLTGWMTREGRRFATSLDGGLLLGIRDEAGRGLEFSYRAAGTRKRPVLHQIRSTDGTQSLTTSYQSYQDAYLTRLERQDGTAQQFRYAGERLAGIVDEYDAGYASYRYDPNGILIGSERGDGAERRSVTYQRPPQRRTREEYDPVADIVYRYHEWALPEGVSVSQPNLPATQYTFTAIAPGPGRASLGRVSSISQPAGAGCGPASSHTEYDTNGNVRSRDDFNGHRVCYAHDARRNLELVRVEGLAGGTDCTGVLHEDAALPDGARKIVTDWHPDWDVAVRRAEPGRLTAWHYHGQPDGDGGTSSCAPVTAVLPDGKPIAVLCERLEQATTDVSGARGFSAPLASIPSRRFSYTYDGSGRVLTEDGPRTDVTDVTTYSYYDTVGADFRPGDLKSVTDAVGKTTRYTRYDGAGRLLEVIAPSGVATLFTYDSRGHRTSETVAGRTTTTTWDARGLPVRVTRPDGSWQTSTYDDAHRLRGTTDSRGTSVELRLDSEGKVTSRIVRRDGAVREQAAWLYDALGRLSRVVFGASGSGGGAGGGTAGGGAVIVGGGAGGSAAAAAGGSPGPVTGGASAGGGSGGGGSAGGGSAGGGSAGGGSAGGGSAGGGSAGGGSAGGFVTPACSASPTDRREQVCQRWRCDRQDLRAGTWTGATAQCQPGDMPEARSNALKLTNLYRFLADLPPVATSQERNDGAQECALMMTANNAINFSPPASWACHSQRGATAASQSSMCSGVGAVRCVDLQMSAFGSTNSNTLGGRRWVLSNDLGVIGIGSTSTHSCHWVIGSSGNAGKAWVAWPPPGPVPLGALGVAGDRTVDQVGWSIQGYTANVTNATVTVTDDGLPLPVTVSNLLAFYGSPSALKFVPNGWVAQAGHTYQVTVSGGSLAAPISYAVEVVACP